MFSAEVEHTFVLHRILLQSHSSKDERWIVFKWGQQLTITGAEGK